ncbi:hypothetical protein JAAARDRAFT_32107 [Jaapia argillacea MUCL 33604]|uniref:3-hydroxyisobutyryl-CoA hydrolase n=1 Tax=Jaapia argillacea MUCL 33604 TaxID=933084 RepID=A0A067Q4L1_9AGAM|nr:hypothetical protein JAAARDRAFT_32107 [Jaapia argillacea MUCL 33604]
MTRLAPGPTFSAIQRTRVIAQHMNMSSKADGVEATEPPVRFESNGYTRTYILNRPKKLNSLNEEMLNLIRPKVEEWDKSDLCKVIIGRGEGRAFCAGGDVANVVENASQPETLPKAIDFFKTEFETDYVLAALQKPYVVIMDGITMGGGVGLTMNAPFRVATEKTMFAMPETKIGYCPDVGASYFLSRLDGELGAYLGMTAEVITGRTVFELGLATHYVPSARIPALLNAISALERGEWLSIDTTIEEHFAERDVSTERSNPLSGAVRVALDKSFGWGNVESILEELRSFAEKGLSLSSDPVAKEKEVQEVKTWAQNTLAALEMRSPTALTVALEAVRRGKKMSLADALSMEFGIATAFCSGASPDFQTGVRAVLIEKLDKNARPNWAPSTVPEVSQEDIISRFFDNKSAFMESKPELNLPSPSADSIPTALSNPNLFALPAEHEIEALVRGSHRTSGDFGLTVEEIVKKLDRDLRPAAWKERGEKGKNGVTEKVLDVIRRRCTVDEGGQWVKWK